MANAEAKIRIQQAGNLEKRRLREGDARPTSTVKGNWSQERRRDPVRGRQEGAYAAAREETGGDKKCVTRKNDIGCDNQDLMQSEQTKERCKGGSRKGGKAPLI